MKKVGKYNLFKGLSTTLTFGTPIATLLATSDLFRHRSDTALSAASLFAILILMLLFKDKIAENFKCPSAFVVSLAVFLLIVLVEKIMMPVKMICLTTMAACGVDELTFKRLYKAIGVSLPEQTELYKHLGFIFTTSKQLGVIDD